MTKIPYVLTVSGSDSSGCAGLQADNRAIHFAGAMPLNVISANTLQTPAGVLESIPTAATVLEKQMRALLEAYPVRAVKLGMLGTAAIVEAMARVLADYPEVFVVLDPVVLSTSGQSLLEDAGLQILNERLLPLVALVTPNLDESELLHPPAGCPVLVKGGHGEGADAVDVLYLKGGESVEFSQSRIATENARGTGCALSSLIAAYVAQGLELVPAIRRAKQELHAALCRNRSVSFDGPGPAFV